jgi:hypothetical protein
MPMSDEMTHIVLEHLRHIRARVDGIDEDLKALTTRFGVLEGHLAQTHVSEAIQNSELDRIKLRLERIERRLELS